MRPKVSWHQLVNALRPFRFRKGALITFSTGAVALMSMGIATVLHSDQALAPELSSAPLPVMPPLVAPAPPQAYAVAEHSQLSPQHRLAAAILAAMEKDAQTAEPPPAIDCADALDDYLSGIQVRFDVGSTRIRPENTDLLEQISDRIMACPTAFVQVAGHADSSGDDATNLALSWDRADMTLNRLLTLGVDPQAAEAIGFGARRPLAEGDAEEDAANRRVAFRVLRRRDAH